MIFQKRISRNSEWGTLNNRAHTCKYLKADSFRCMQYLKWKRVPLAKIEQCHAHATICWFLPLLESHMADSNIRKHMLRVLYSSHCCISSMLWYAPLVISVVQSFFQSSLCYWWRNVVQGCSRLHVILHLIVRMLMMCEMNLTVNRGT